MNGIEFRSHRDWVIDIFKTFHLTEGLIVYQSPPQPQEWFTDSELPFVQEGLFFWLTGWNDPDTTILIDIATGQSIFFIQDYTLDHVIWHGSVPTDELVLNQTGVDAVDVLPNLATTIESIAPSVIYATPEQLTFEFANIDRHTLLVATSIARTVKSPVEIGWLRKAAQITGEVIIEVLKSVRWHEGMIEREVEAHFQYYASMKGCRDVAFITIVGAGTNACFLHYDKCTSEVKKGDLILLDCGVFYRHYAGDITRTFPASGKFSPDQATVYNGLLTLQKLLISHVKPGVEIADLGEEMRVGIFDILLQIGVVSAEVPYDGRIGSFFVPHGLSHDIGCNVHDLCGYQNSESKIQDVQGRNKRLVPGQIISIEPGIYFHPTRIAEITPKNAVLSQINREVALRFSQSVGGIRIEDDVLVTEDGCEVLSAGCPKEINEIEALLALSPA